MLRQPTIIKKTLSVRISLMVVMAMAILQMVSMIVMLHYSRKAIKEEALQKATQTLESTIQRLDNTMLGIEQTMGNIYFNMLPNINNRDLMETYARKVIETNTNVAGCAIAFKKGYFKDNEPFIAYVHRSDSAGIAYAGSEVVTDDSFGNKPYYEQAWFTKTIETGKITWMNPFVDMKDANESPIFTYCLPIYDPANISKGKKLEAIGVIGVDVSLSLLSSIVEEVNLSENSYCTLLDKDGTFIVHPISKKLINMSALEMKDQSAKEAAISMVSGETGYRPFRLDNKEFYVFYKPFKRLAIPEIFMDDLQWSAGIIYPKDDIFGDYNSLLYYVIAIAIGGLLVLFLLSCAIIHHQLTPLLMLSKQAHHIARGNYDVPIPDSRHHDEIGRLQSNFKQMQQSLATNIGELEQLTTNMKRHGQKLAEAYKQAQKADRMKTSFLHNMTNQMLAPSNIIEKDVQALCDMKNGGKSNCDQLADDIQQKGNTITELLKNLINMSDEDMRKEGENV